MTDSQGDTHQNTILSGFHVKDSSMLTLVMVLGHLSPVKLLPLLPMNFCPWPVLSLQYTPPRSSGIFFLPVHLQICTFILVCIPALSYQSCWYFFELVFQNYLHKNALVRLSFPLCLTAAVFIWLLQGLYPQTHVNPAPSILILSSRFTTFSIWPDIFMLIRSSGDSASRLFKSPLPHVSQI